MDGEVGGRKGWMLREILIWGRDDGDFFCFWWVRGWGGKKGGERGGRKEVDKEEELNLTKNPSLERNQNIEDSQTKPKKRKKIFSSFYSFTTILRNPTNSEKARLCRYG